MKPASKASGKYNDKNYEYMRFFVPKGEKVKIKAHAESKGESVNGLINRLLKAEMAESEEPK
jgi:hypothetical protein